MIWLKLSKNRNFFSFLEKNQDFLKNSLEKITIFEKYRFCPDFSKNPNFGKICQKISILVNIFVKITIFNKFSR